MSNRQAFNPIDRAVRRMRARSLTRHIPSGSRVLDVGCGLDNWLIRSMTGRSADGWHPDSLGIDPDLEDTAIDARGRRAGVADVARSDPGGFDAATSLAVVEHLPPDDVTDHLDAIRSALRPGGVLVLTTPTPRSRPLLEFLAFRLHLISAHEIRDHRHYYDRDELIALLAGTGFERIEHRPFQVGLNQRVTAHRPPEHGEAPPP